MVFARSDQDLVLVLAPQERHGQELARLYQRLRGLRWLNPALCHLEVVQASELVRLASIDSAWAFQESRSGWPLWGDLPRWPSNALQPDHALGRFLLWCEVFIPSNARRGSPRHRRKLALECWNFFAAAQSLLPGPLVHRRAMAQHLQAVRGEPTDLAEPSGMMSFVLNLASEMHATRRPPLAGLARPWIGTLRMAPHGTRRPLWVLPTADWPLPERLPPGVLLATPQLLDLFLGFKNGWIWWDLPRPLRDLGLTPPRRESLHHQARYYASPHFLRYPGFADPRAPHPGYRLACLERALPWLSDDPPVDGPEWPEELTFLQGPSRIVSYYRHEYDALMERCQALEQALLGGAELSEGGMGVAAVDGQDLSGHRGQAE